MANSILKMSEMLKETYKLSDKEEKQIKNILMRKGKYDDIQGVYTLFKAINEDLIKHEMDIDGVENDIYEIQDELAGYESILENEYSQEELDWIYSMYSSLRTLIKEKMNAFKLELKAQRGDEKLIMLLMGFFKPYLETYFTESELKEMFYGFEFNYINEFIFPQNEKELCQ